ncbi:hypothetical protein DICVIV_06331 [Dictyocaulus viviparus]|uniref:M protein repeat protein n=1 Tax=Dictyocaulus viviparus TaxID=29172 RepID=A0A0D8XUY0_DICVI|nr:hypothetical protein DICVIV_06331 [Dictyocaulus viviparus]
MEEYRLAVEEHRRTNGVLHEQLQCLEEESHNIGGDSINTKARLLQLEGDLQWKQDECISLRRRVDELQATIDQLICKEQDSGAAKLATRQADVDALFRANAELVHTNVRLQNELDENEDRLNDIPHELQNELSKIRQNERSLLLQVTELQQQLVEARKKVNVKFDSEEKMHSKIDAETQHEDTPVTESCFYTYEEVANLPEPNMELNGNQLTDLRKEVERLEAVEILLNERIVSLEDQLLEEEERFQEIESELLDERQKAQSLETDNAAMKKKLSQLEVMEQKKESSETNLKWTNTSETTVGYCGQLHLGNPMPKQTSSQIESNEVSLVRDVGKSYDGLWDSMKLIKNNSLSSTCKEDSLDSQKKRSISFKSSTNEHAASESEKNFCAQTYKHTENESSAAHEVEPAQELLQKEEISKSTVVKEEGWDFDDFKDDYLCETLINRELCGKDLNATEGLKELRRLLMQAYQRISELELQIEQKVCALVDAEKELAVLRERQNVSEEDSRKKDLERDAEDSWRAIVSSTDQAESDITTERNRRREAEALADNLRSIAASLRTQIDDIQAKWLEEIQKVEDKQVEIEKLRSIVVSRAELQEAEYQRSESELETLCEERRRLQDDLTSAENEKMRLEEQLISSNTLCDDLKAELQTQKLNFAEVVEKYEEALKCCKDAQTTSLIIDTEEASPLRLKNSDGSSDDLRCQLESCEFHEKETIQKLSSALKVKETEVNILETTIKEIRKELEEKENQNSLLKDSEALLLDSVDEYGQQAEMYQQESERLRNVVSVLEKEKIELEIKLQDKTKKMDGKYLCRSTSTTSLRSNEEFLSLDRKLEAVTRERNELCTRLEEMESRLKLANQEKLSITLSYEKLRNQLSVHRQTINTVGETTRRPSVVSSEACFPEEPRRSEDSSYVLPKPFEVYQVGESDILRRRIGHH